MQRSGVRSPRRPPILQISRSRTHRGGTPMPADLSVRMTGMVLSDVDIKRYLELGKIKIDPPLPPEQYGSCSVDFRLGREFNVFEHSRHAFIDLRAGAALEGIMRPLMVEPNEPF